MIRYVLRLDRWPLAITAAALVAYLLLALHELASPVYGMTTSLVPYLSLILGVVWAAPLLARELESGTASWAWGMGITRRRWLASRAAVPAAAAVVSALILTSLVELSTARWPSWMGDDRLSPAYLAAHGPAIVAFSIFAVALGFAAAALTGRLVPAIGVTLAGQLAAAYAFPSLAAALAPRTTTLATSYAGHFISQRVIDGRTITTYIPDSYYWPVEISMTAAILLTAVLLATAATLRTARRPG
ncbi:MAG: hypothetical protein ACRDRJ_20415 [Streptosporangiaceae bacterium]